ncbi:MAG: metallopeptidase TldD-related protein [Candidatus Bathyarchaeia archaeon]
MEVFEGMRVYAHSVRVEADTRYTQASFEVNTKAGEEASEGSGFAVERSKDVRALDFEEIASSAAEDAVNSIRPKTVPTGDYEAIFKPEAVSTFIMFMGMLGFSARANQEGYSFIGDKLGDRVFDEKLTVLDNGRDTSTLNASPFDGEGVPKRALMLVNRGVAENLCYDTYHALKTGKEGTGHALSKLGGAWYGDFPLPINQVVEPGDASLEEMIEETGRGVLITRLHYVNPIKRDKGIISGMTRDGTWYIEDGEVKHPVKVMRFTDSITRVLTEIRSMGDETTVKTLPYATSPAIHAGRFKFTGQSEF